jgi:hypothetical protein
VKATVGREDNGSMLAGEGRKEGRALGRSPREGRTKALLLLVDTPL